MPGNGEHLRVEVQDVNLAQLLKLVQERRQPVRILSNGQHIADLSPAAPAVSPARPLREPPTDCCLKVTFSSDYDPTAGASEEDWPADLR